MNPAALSYYQIELRVRRKLKQENDSRIRELEELVRGQRA